MSSKILVTGATGNVGREVVKSLLEMGQPVIAAVLDEQDARRVPEGADPRRFQFDCPDTFTKAFKGVDKLFLMRPPQIADVKRYLFPVIEYARAAGVKQIAFLSLIGVERNPMVPHYKVEKYLERCGIPYTFIRPSFYMQNLNTTHRQEIREKHEIGVPVGHARTSFIDVRDIGAVSARILVEPGLTGKACELTGSEALDYYQVADFFSQILGYKVTYTNPSLWRFFQEARARKVPVGFALVMAGLYTSTRFGMAQQITSDVERLLGRPPITLRQYIQDYAAAWIE